MHLPPSDTIAALATPPGRGAIGIIRLSGTAAAKILARLFTVQQLLPRHFYHGSLLNPQTGEKLDDVCCVFFPGPSSYTGEDVVEIHGHGNPLTLQSIMQVLLAEGARLADKGEFTKRAFLNGKIDLTEAEGVLELINARSSKAQKMALAHLQGSLFQVIQDIRNRLLVRLAAGEATLDFPDDVPPGATQDEPEVQAIITQLILLLKNQDFGQKVTGAIKCLIVGRPNVGKSSLLNCLAGEERSIVTAIPGTTRDFIDVQIELGGLLFEFIDTAGLRRNPDAVEKIGFKKITTLMSQAQLVFWVLDSSQTYSAEDALVWQKIRKKLPLYLILNKADKKRRLVLPTALQKYPALSLSANKKSGLSVLKDRLCQDFVGRADELDIDLLCNTRQINGLKAALTSLQAFVGARQSRWPEDLALLDLKEAVLHLGRITGAELNEEVLTEIFSNFCIGK